MVHFENASNRVFCEGELTQEGQPRALLAKTMPELFDKITEGLRYALHDDAGDKW
jgi:hypothetical protein